MSSSPALAMPGQATEQQWKRPVRADQIRLLYANTNAAVRITVGMSVALDYLQWGDISHSVILSWLAYMLAISAGRFALGRLFRRAVPADTNIGVWGIAFVAGMGLSAAGWGVAGILLYPEGHMANQVLLAYGLGGMMLGCASINGLGPRHSWHLLFRQEYPSRCV
jgi:hypothetical protein